MNGKLIVVAYAVCGVVLVGCATSAVDPKKPGDEALTCAQIQAEIDAQDATARQEAGKPGRSKPAHPPIKPRNGCPLWVACCLS